jgi:hypothetical protein
LNAGTACHIGKDQPFERNLAHGLPFSRPPNSCRSDQTKVNEQYGGGFGDIPDMEIQIQ